MTETNTSITSPAEGDWGYSIPTEAIKDRSLLALLSGFVSLIFTGIFFSFFSPVATIIAIPVLGFTSAATAMLSGWNTMSAYDAAETQGLAPIKVTTGKPANHDRAFKGFLLGLGSSGFQLFVIGLAVLMLT